MKRFEAIIKYKDKFKITHSSMYGSFRIPIADLWNYSIEKDVFTIRYIDPISGEECKKDVSSKALFFTVKKVKDDITEEYEEKTYSLSDCPVK